MKIEMKTLYAGPSGSINPGQVADLPDAEARALIDGGYAISAEPEKPAPKAKPKKDTPQPEE